MDARDDLDQRRLAGAIVTDERDHLARANLEVDVAQRIDGSEAATEPPRRQNRRPPRHLPTW